jgi:hypothetical protein
MPQEMDSYKIRFNSSSYMTQNGALCGVLCALIPRAATVNRTNWFRSEAVSEKSYIILEQT